MSEPNPPNESPKTEQRNDLIIALGVIGVVAAALLATPIPIGCCGLGLYFPVLIGLLFFAISKTARTFSERTALRDLFLIVFLWACIAAMLPFFVFAVHAVGWVMTR